MKHEIDLNWDGGMQFTTAVDGHNITIDAPEAAGGKNNGPTPKKFMLVALAGCTGMDVVSLMNKMRVEYDSLNIKVEAEVTEEHPKHYTSMTVIYEIKGKNVDETKVEKAVNMSIEKYCGVSAVYGKAMELKHEIRIEK